MGGSLTGSFHLVCNGIDHASISLRAQKCTVRLLMWNGLSLSPCLKSIGKVAAVEGAEEASLSTATLT